MCSPLAHQLFDKLRVLLKQLALSLPLLLSKLVIPLVDQLVNLVPLLIFAQALAVDSSNVAILIRVRTSSRQARSTLNALALRMSFWALLVGETGESS